MTFHSIWNNSEGVINYCVLTVLVKWKLQACCISKPQEYPNSQRIVHKFRTGIGSIPFGLTYIVNFLTVSI